MPAQVPTEHLFRTQQTRTFPHFIMQLAQREGEDRGKTLVVCTVEMVLLIVLIAQLAHGFSVHLVVAYVTSHAFKLVVCIYIFSFI